MTPFGLWSGDSHIGFGTHVPTLASAVLQARPGPVLEYGCGFYSTPLLHMLCEEMGRQLLSLDGDPPWAEKFAGLRAAFHDVVGVSSWEASETIVDTVPAWSVVFIDHGPEERRAVDIRRLRDRAEFIVVHDWIQGGSREFAHEWVSRTAPYTAVLSNVRPFRLHL